MNWDNPIDPIHAQKLAVKWLEWACANGQVSEAHPRYKLVTENRDWGAGYSSCGDLAHWLLYRLGVRASWVNRTEHNGWKVGQNVSLLAWNRLAQTVEDTMIVEPGDVFVIWSRQDGTDAHVLVAIDRQGDTLLTAEYGQPGGALKSRQIVQRGKHVYLGNRRVQKRLPLLTVLSVAQEEGMLEGPEEPPTSV